MLLAANWLAELICGSKDAYILWFVFPLAIGWWFVLKRLLGGL